MLRDALNDASGRVFVIDSESLPAAVRLCIGIWQGCVEEAGFGAS